MRPTRWLLAGFVALMLLAAPVAASADGQVVHDALAGTAFDPLATTIEVVPPKGGAVMIYRRGAVHGWWWQPGVTAVRPGQVYGVLAIVGTSMVFNAGVLVRPGITSLVWDGGSLPRVAYYPRYRVRPVAVAVRSHRGRAADSAGRRRRAASAHRPASSRSEQQLDAATAARPGQRRLSGRVSLRSRVPTSAAKRRFAGAVRLPAQRRLARRR